MAHQKSSEDLTFSANSLLLLGGLLEASNGGMFGPIGMPGGCPCGCWCWSGTGAGPVAVFPLEAGGS